MGGLGMSAKSTPTLRETEKRILALERMPVMVVITDPEGKIEYVNPEFTNVTGYSHKEAVGQDLCFLSSGRQPKYHFAQMWESIKTGKQWSGEFSNYRKTGEEYWELAAISPVLNTEGEILFFVAVKRDITPEHQREEEITRLALYDQLTQLPNRTLFLDRLKQAINISARKNQSFALVVYDLDGFKPINDTYGHFAGDHALRVFGERLQKGIRKMDTAARLGGDEFALLLLDIASPEEVEKKLLRLEKSLVLPILWENTTFLIGTSWGISFFPTEGDSVEELVQLADIRMYRHKLERNKGR